MNPVVIHDYDSHWPRRFEELRLQIASVLDDVATTIEHVGSTAVPGLAAKPIIDIDVLLRSATDLPLVLTRLASLGYEHRGDLGVAGREAFRTPRNHWPHHLYVCLPDSPEFLRHITFRDHLRSHPQDASAYATLKHELARRCGNDRDAYNRGKAEFVTDILLRAGTL